MKAKLLGLVACMALLGASQAQAITYTMDEASGTTSVTGFIQTDGNLGILSATDITNFDLKLTTNSETANMVANALTLAFVKGSDFTATENLSRKKYSKLTERLESFLTAPSSVRAAGLHADTFRRGDWQGIRRISDALKKVGKATSRCTGETPS